MKIRNVTISKEDTIEIKKFVEDSFQTNIDKYKKRNQENISKIKNDIYIGKLAEYAVYYLYNERKGCIVKKPDIEVYEANKKSFNADLNYIKEGKKYEIHVKAQYIEQSKRFGKSWSFQKEDSLTTRPKTNEFIVFCSVLDNKTVEVIQPIRATKLKEFYSDPKLDKLKGIKKVIYFNDIKHLNNIPI